MYYKVVRGMVPAINADELLIPIRNKRNIKPRVHLTSKLQILRKNSRLIIQSASKYRILTQKNIETHSLLEL